jgi:hypothetical protein
MKKAQMQKEAARIVKAEANYNALRIAKAEDGIKLPSLNEIDKFIADELDLFVPPEMR